MSDMTAPQASKAAADANKSATVAIVPTLGRIVHYRMPFEAAAKINQRRKDAQEKAAWHLAIRSGAQIHVGNEVKEGKLYPAMIVEVWGETPTSCVNLQVFLDGNDTYWATSVNVGDKPGNYEWMAYQKGQAAKTEQLEQKLGGVS